MRQFCVNHRVNLLQFTRFRKKKKHFKNYRLNLDEIMCVTEEFIRFAVNHVVKMPLAINSNLRPSENKMVVIMQSLYTIFVPYLRSAVPATFTLLRTPFNSIFFRGPPPPKKTYGWFFLFVKNIRCTSYVMFFTFYDFYILRKTTFKINNAF